METIKHAVVWSDDGNFFIGKCHSDCVEKMFHLKIAIDKNPEAQGFVTSEGRYVKRREAYQIASNSGQIRENPGIRNESKILFSEDLWSDEFRSDPYNYCEIMGYWKEEDKNESLPIK